MAPVLNRDIGDAMDEHERCIRASSEPGLSCLFAFGHSLAVTILNFVCSLRKIIT